MNDLFLTNKQKLWLWMKAKKQFSSVDITRYGLANYYICASRRVREWSEDEDITGIVPRLLRISKQDKIFRGLVTNGNANIAFYELNPQYEEIAND